MNTPSDDHDRSSEPTEVSQGEDEQGPGWMPAILAATALFAILGFVVCAFSTWILFQKRTEFAIRTLEGGYLAQLEQSQLDLETKTAVVREIEALIEGLKEGQYENWQAAGIMQRLQRLPVLQWGELQAVEAYLENADDDALSDEARADGLKQIGRLKQALELNKVTSFDFEDALEPVRKPAPNRPSGQELDLPLKPKAVLETTRRAKQLADRSKVPDQEFQDIRIERILRREIERGASEGGY